MKITETFEDPYIRDKQTEVAVELVKATKETGAWIEIRADTPLRLDMDGVERLIVMLSMLRTRAGK